MATYNKIQVEDKNEGEKIAWAQSKTKIILATMTWQFAATPASATSP